jgi:methionine aminopeptidase
MAGFNPGDILVDDLTLVSPRTSSWQLGPNFLSAEITETIFTPIVLAYIEVVDDRDYVGTLQLQGDEQVNFSFRNPAGTKVNYAFHLNSIKDVGIWGPMKSKVYKLECVTREAMYGQVNHVQKTYNTTIGDMVQQVIKDYIPTNGQVFVETTKGNRKFVVPNVVAYDWIDKMRTEAVSAQNKSSNYMFWQTWRGFYFQSLEYMLQQGSVKTFKQENTIGTSLSKTVDDNILAWEVKQTMDAMNRIHAGVTGHRITTYDIHTHKYVTHDYNPKTEELALLGKVAITTMATFLSLFNKGVQTHFRVTNPRQSVKVGPSYVPANIPYKQLNLAQMQEQLMHMTAIGDPNLEPGKTITANVPKISSQTGINQAEPQMSGQWLISKTHHEIRRPDIRPRWVSNLECIKGAMEGA